MYIPLGKWFIVEFIVLDHGIFKPINNPEELIECQIPAVARNEGATGFQRRPFKFQNFDGN